MLLRIQVAAAALLALLGAAGGSGPMAIASRQPRPFRIEGPTPLPPDPRGLTEAAMRTMTPPPPPLALPTPSMTPRPKMVANHKATKGVHSPKKQTSRDQQASEARPQRSPLALRLLQEAYVQSAAQQAVSVVPAPPQAQQRPPQRYNGIFAASAAPHRLRPAHGVFPVPSPEAARLLASAVNHQLFSDAPSATYVSDSPMQHLPKPLFVPQQHQLSLQQATIQQLHQKQKQLQQQHQKAMIRQQQAAIQQLYQKQQQQQRQLLESQKKGHQQILQIAEQHRQQQHILKLAELRQQSQQLKAAESQQKSEPPLQAQQLLPVTEPSQGSPQKLTEAHTEQMQLAQPQEHHQVVLDAHSQSQLQQEAQLAQLQLQELHDQEQQHQQLQLQGLHDQEQQHQQQLQHHAEQQATSADSQLDGLQPHPQPVFLEPDSEMPQQDYDQARFLPEDTRYNYVYRVKDSEGGNNYGHSEARSGERTWGQYYVQMPDGRLKTVRYWADDSGYHAEVEYAGEAHHPQPADEPTAEQT